MLDATHLDYQISCKRHIIARSILSLEIFLTAVGINSAYANEVQAATNRANLQFSIPEGTLDQVINNFAISSGIHVAVNSELTSGKRSAGLTGNYNIKEGLDKILKESSLEAVAVNDGFYIRKHITDNNTLDTILVTSDQVRTKNPISEDQESYIVEAVTIGKVAQQLKDIPQSVSVLSRKQIEDQNLETVDQALRQVTGVTTNLYGDGTAGYQSRGYDLTVQYDGLPASSALQMATQFDLAMYDRIEVLRGPNGLLQGAGSPSGTVNFVHKRPTKVAQGSISLSAGSYDSYHGEMDVSGPLNDAASVRGRAVIAAQDRDFATSIKHNQQEMIYGVVEADITPNTTLFMSGAYQYKNAQRFMGIPTSTATGQLINASPSSFFGANGGYSKYPMQEIILGAEHRFSDDGWKVNATIRQEKITSDLLYGYISSRVSSSNTANVTLARTYYEESNLGLDLHIDGPFSLLGRQHTAMLGYNIDQYSYEGGSRTRTLTGQSIYKTDYDLNSVGGILNKSARKLDQSGLYGVTRFQITDPLTIVVGGRISDYNYQTRTVAPTPAAWKTSSHVTGQITPYSGLVWKVNPQHNYYVSYTDIFTPQDDVYDVNNNRLDPKKGWQIETGVKSEWLSGRLNTSASLYRIEEKNRAILDGAHTDCGGAGNDCYRAAGLVRSQGIDLEAIGRLGRGWDISLGYSYNDNEYLKDSSLSNIGSRYSTTTPRNSVKLWTNYLLPGVLSQYRIGGGLQWQSKTSNTLTNGSVLRQGSYTVAGLQGSYRLSSSTDITLTVNNLFDRRYYERLRSTWGYNYFGDPRNYMLTIRSKF